MSASIIRFVSTNLANRLEQIGNGASSVDPLELRQLKMPLDRRSLGANSSAVKRVAEMVTQEYVRRLAIQAAQATNSSAVKRVAETVTHEWETYASR
jgi:hypothetical protein